MGDGREVICIICPEGCHIRLKDGSPDSMDAIGPDNLIGYKCKRGMAYALSEFTNPVRVLTTTVRVDDGDIPMLPVKSAKPLPKGLLMECMKLLSGLTADAPVKKGDVLVKDILGTGIDIIATGNVARKVMSEANFLGGKDV